MLRVYSCIAQDHNLLLVVVAGIICLLAVFTAFSASLRAAQIASRRAVYVVTAALVSGLGIWATHFIAMLAYEPGLTIAYDIPKTLLSALTAVVISGAGWTVALRERPAMAPLGGAIIGTGIAAMHYLGMSAVQLNGEILWDDNLVIVSGGLGVGLAACAVWLHRRKPKDPNFAASFLLALAICSLHFTGMAAVTIYPHQGIDVAPQSIDSQALAVIITLATLVMLGLGAGIVLFDRKLAANQLAEAQQSEALAAEILRGASERERLTAELKRQVEISKAALDNMAQGLSMYDADDRLVVINRRHAELYDLLDEPLEPGTPFAEVSKRMTSLGVVRRTVVSSLDTKVDEARRVVRHELHMPDGRIIEFHRCSLPGGGWVATHDDVTEARAANQQIAYLAAHDTLTGLPNRATFFSQLDVYAKRGQHFAVHTIDLDRFKEVNDTLGHPLGDEILKGAAARLRELTGKQDVVTRLGGDEFAVMQIDIASSTPAELAGRIVERLSEPFEFEGHTIVIGASVGISVAPTDGADAEELLKLSDLALYSAKNESRGTYRFFERGMDSRLCARRQLEEDLRVAIREGQFEVHYQPLLDASTGTIRCCEALVRWRHPSRGLVAPADFIATAEDSGLIIPIGEWVLRQACQDAATWPADVRVAVNVSPAQFKRGDLIAMTVSALSAAGLEPTRLELEITEAVLLHDETWVLSALKQLTALGVRIVMDDFGTGYSSLNYLRRFPFNKIKIDRSFVADLVDTPDAFSIIQATILLSQKLGMEVTAEGVETPEQMQILTDEGCTQIQGYHVSRPVPAAGIAGLLDVYNFECRSRAQSAG
ncbi:diguanylate cyclase [Novosphingobium endophyticum]|uniref:Diguanylate cyclase n=1 Tax=Novosphingobium endophyticum TaxID=1955250 RepID=A0A916TV04_9SPHN|nr:EAL domain-containing protein [Novosphingobium endophyticum]GGC13244.1 diguanylate cyclase [Novosphingobium endophyticum]